MADESIYQYVPEDEPCFVISVAAKMLGMHQQTLRYYERVGIIEPSRSRGNIRLYSQSDINRLRQVQRLMNDLGVNLAGAEVILQMSARLRQAEQELAQARAELEQYRSRTARKAPSGR